MVTKISDLIRCTPDYADWVDEFYTDAYPYKLCSFATKKGNTWEYYINEYCFGGLTKQYELRGVSVLKIYLYSDPHCDDYYENRNMNHCFNPLMNMRIKDRLFRLIKEFLPVKLSLHKKDTPTSDSESDFDKTSDYYIYCKINKVLKRNQVIFLVSMLRYLYEMPLVIALYDWYYVLTHKSQKRFECFKDYDDLQMLLLLTQMYNYNSGHSLIHFKEENKFILPKDKKEFKTLLKSNGGINYYNGTKICMDMPYDNRIPRDLMLSTGKFNEITEMINEFNIAVNENKKN